MMRYAYTAACTATAAAGAGERTGARRRTTVVHLVARGAPRLAHLPHAAEPRAPGGYTVYYAVKYDLYSPGYFYRSPLSFADFALLSQLCTLSPGPARAAAGRRMMPF